MCMYVCMYVWMDDVRMNIRMYVRNYVFMHICTISYVYMSYVFRYVRMHVSKDEYICIYVRVYACIRYVCMYVRKYVCDSFRSYAIYCSCSITEQCVLTCGAPYFRSFALLILISTSWAEMC
jgi:hypothetical protein